MESSQQEETIPMDRQSRYCIVCDLDSPEKYQCEKCHFTSDFKVLLKKHYYTVHKTKETEHYPTPDVFRCCENCDFHTYSSLVLLNHDNQCDKKGHFKVKSEHADVSETAQDVVARLRAKIKKSLEHDGKTFSIPKRKKTGLSFLQWLECDQCPYKTTKEHTFKVHMRKHKLLEQSSNWLKCKHCSYRTELKSVLRRHVLARHTADVEAVMVKYVECDQCSYKTRRIGYLKDHILSKHTPSEQINWIKCDHCSYRTIRKGDLKAHNYKIHTPTDQISWFECEHCPYKAKQKATLRRHLNRHLMKLKKTK